MNSGNNTRMDVRIIVGIFLINSLIPLCQVRNGNKRINSYFAHIARVYIKYIIRYLFFKPKYNDNNISNIPYSAPYEYGKIKLNTFGDNIDTDRIKRIIDKLYVIGKYLFDIMYVIFSIPSDAINPAKNNTLSLVPKINIKNALII